VSPALHPPALHGAVQLHPRFRYALSADVQLPSESRLSFVRSIDLSGGGLFLACDRPIEPGTFMPLRFTLDRRPLIALVKVVHTLDRPRALRHGREPGVGVTFVRMNGMTRMRLDGLLHELEQDALRTYGATGGLMPGPHQPLPIVLG
jgi:hypothetical protein